MSRRRRNGDELLRGGDGVLAGEYGSASGFRPEMSGTAEIITENLTVFDRLVNPLRAVVKR